MINTALQKLPKEYRFFDSASTTNCIPAAADRVRTFLLEHYGNPSSSHAFGITAQREIEVARDFFARHFRVGSDQIIFTSSGTEANNLAIQGVVLAKLLKNSSKAESKKWAVLTLPTEHASVAQTCLALQKWGVEVVPLPLLPEAPFVDFKNLETWLNELQGRLEANATELVLASIQTVNQVTGAIFPVSQLSKSLRNVFPEILIHSDAVQAFAKTTLPKDVDALSLSSHKIHGPKGCGALVLLNPKLRQDANLRPLLFGGGQEGGKRSGTLNTGAIAGFYEAARWALQHQNVHEAHCEALLLLLQQELQANLVQMEWHWNSPQAKDSRTSRIVSLSFPGIPAGALTNLLEERGCLVSRGSACSSKKQSVDPALQGFGLRPELQASAIRISISSFTQQDDIHALVQALSESIQILARLHQVSSTRTPRSQRK